MCEDYKSSDPSFLRIRTTYDQMKVEIVMRPKLFSKQGSTIVSEWKKSNLSKLGIESEWPDIQTNILPDTIKVRFYLKAVKML